MKKGLIIFGIVALVGVVIFLVINRGEKKPRYLTV